MIVNLNEKEYRVLKRVLREAFFFSKTPKISDKEIAALSADFCDYVKTESPDIYGPDDLKRELENYLREQGKETLIGTKAENKIILSLFSMLFN